MSEGLPYPLGATWDGLGVNFALFSRHATKVELCLFDETGETELERIELPEYTDEVWHGYLPRCAARARSMAIACMAPTSRRTATASIRNKLLLDPYASAHIGELTWDPAVFGYTDRRRRRRPDLRRTRQRAVHAEMPRRRSRLHLGPRERKPRVPWERTIFYETHVRGFTKLPSRSARASARHLRRTGAARRSSTTSESLGVTSVELLPIHTFINDRHLLDKGLTNYWGYNTIGFFAPDPRFAATRPSRLPNSRRWSPACTTRASR